MGYLKDGGPAFPQPCTENGYASNTLYGIAGGGVSMRDYFAIRAPEPTKETMDMERLRDRNRNPYNDSYKPPIRSDMEIRCALAYEYADAMIKAREA